MIQSIKRGALTALVCFAATIGLVESNSAQSLTEQNQWAMDARSALADQDYQSALQAAIQLADSSPTGVLQMVAADTLLRCGDSKRAIEQFENHLKRRPGDRPHLWQLGIAQYFEGKFEDGAKLFEIHREVNPNDVENAAWHFLCVAKKDSPAAAKTLLLPAPGDPRPPMKEVLEMLRSGDTEAVQRTMDSFTPGTPKARSAKFYGNFYLGLYADALGDLGAARNYLNAAAKDAPANYMGDVAKVYSRHLKKQPKP